MRGDDAPLSIRPLVAKTNSDRWPAGHERRTACAALASGDGKSRTLDTEPFVPKVLKEGPDNEGAAAAQTPHEPSSLEESERRFRALVENAFDAINLLGADGTILYKIPGRARPLGYGDALVGHSIFEIVHAEDRQRVAGLYADLAGRPGGFARAELRVRHASGDWRWIDAAVTNLLDEPAVRAIVLNYRDITDTRRGQADLELTARLASLGSLAAGIAHELSNPLAYAIGQVDVARRCVSKMLASELPARVRRGLNEVETCLLMVSDGTQRVADIGSDLRRLASGGAASNVAVNVERVMDAALSVAAAELRRANVRREYSGVPAVLGDERRLGQLFLNLLVNAAHALPEQGAAGSVVVSTRVGVAGRVVVEVEDSGLGIEPDHLPHVFEPFFTTKPSGKGMGLGLSISQRIAKDMGGEIEVESTLGRGSTFRVTLPAAPASK